MRTVLFAAVICVGCYKPSYRDCDVSCASGACPSGYSCNAEQKCVAQLGTSCGSNMMADSGPSGPDASYCGEYAFPISNVTCPLAKTTFDWTVTGQETIRSASPPVVPAGGPTAELSGSSVLIRVHDLTVAAGATLTISGDSTATGLPLIIVASGTVKIDGMIVVSPMKWTDDVTLFGTCGLFASNGPTCGSVGGSGGGGGGFGPIAIAAAGGACLGGSGGDPGVSNGTPDLVPLRGGCPGGIGSHASGQGGLGGEGGGALQISATKLEINGKINVGGGGAYAGPQSGDGGGGGGAGGGLLLETANGHLGPASALCANGGGGSSDTEPGQRGTCSESAAAGGAGVGAEGGAGAFGSVPAVTGGLGSMTIAAGGGGGGVGRIRLNGPFVRDAGAIVTPPDA